MKTQLIAIGVAIGAVLLSQCSQEPASQHAGLVTEAKTPYNGGFDSQTKWGEHLVTVIGCHDCHTPKKMTAFGPVLDSTRMLSGHPADMPAPEVNRAELEQKGLAVTGTLTAWVGPWGTSYSANLTSDDTGIGTWSEAQFMRALREGKFKGLEGSRPLLPPMPWQMYKNLTDDEIKAIYAYLKSTKPVRNIVPAAEPPLAAAISKK